MNDLSVYLKTIYRISLSLFSVCLLVWAVIPEYRSLVAGLMLGMLVSLLNIWYLSMKIRQLSALAREGTRRRFNLGFLTRASMAVLAVMFAVKLEQIDLAATIVGLFYAPSAILVLGILSRHSK